MEVNWLIEIEGFADTTPQKLLAAARSLNLNVGTIKYVPFAETIEEMSIDGITIGPDSCVVAYCSINLAGVLQKHIQKYNWLPGLWCNFNKFRCQCYYSHLGEFLLQQDYAFLPLAELERRKDWIFKTFANGDGEIFIRPDEVHKPFPGQVVARKKFDQWIDNITLYLPRWAKHEEILAVVSRPSKIYKEWRFIIADRKVLTGSMYKEGADFCYMPTWEPGAALFAEEIAASKYEPYPVYVIDVCRTDDGYRMIETGPVNVAGLYACDLKKYMLKLNEVALREWLVAHP